MNDIEFQARFRQYLQAFRQAIIDELLARGESILADSGVDAAVCAEISDELIVEFAKIAGTDPSPPRVLIEIEGGLLSNVFSDFPVLYKTKDWDNIDNGDGAVFLRNLADWNEPDVVYDSLAELQEEARSGVAEKVPELTIAWTCPACQVPNQDLYDKTATPNCAGCHKDVPWEQLLSTERLKEFDVLTGFAPAEGKS